MLAYKAGDTSFSVGERTRPINTSSIVLHKNSMGCVNAQMAELAMPESWGLLWKLKGGECDLCTIRQRSRRYKEVTFKKRKTMQNHCLNRQSCKYRMVRWEVYECSFLIEVYAHPSFLHRTNREEVDWSSRSMETISKNKNNRLQATLYPKFDVALHQSF